MRHTAGRAVELAREMSRASEKPSELFGGRSYVATGTFSLENRVCRSRDPQVRLITLHARRS